jgi:hypothetical protein
MPDAAQLRDEDARRGSQGVIPGPPLLTLNALAALLHRTPVGMRQALKRDTDFAAQLRASRVKLGRRIYFRRDLVDRMIFNATGQ